jgi:hypothetical protein
VNIVKDNDRLIIASGQTIKGIRAYLIIGGYGEEEEKNPKNLEILKVFVSQAIFLYSYVNLPDDNNCQ